VFEYTHAKNAPLGGSCLSENMIGISQGGVANIVDYYNKYDISLQLQRQLVLYIQKTGTDVFQLASDIRFVTALKFFLLNVKF
jgi:hypothetical protein